MPLPESSAVVKGSGSAAGCLLAVGFLPMEELRKRHGCPSYIREDSHTVAVARLLKTERCLYGLG